MASFSAAIIQGLFADQPTDNNSNTAGRLFYATDTEQLFRDNGTTWDEWVLGASSSSPSYIHLREQQSTGVAGSTSSAATWNTLVLNTEVSDADSMCSLATNRFTLQPGTYDVKAIAPNYLTHESRLRIYDITHSAVILLGVSVYNANNGGLVNLQGRMVVSGVTVYELQEYTTSAQAQGLGVPMSDGQLEIYADIELYKVA